MKEGQWERSQYVGVGITGKNLVVMGFGKVRGARLISCKNFVRMKIDRTAVPLRHCAYDVISWVCTELPPRRRLVLAIGSNVVVLGT